MPTVTVCGPELCARVTVGHVSVSSTGAGLKAASIDGKFTTIETSRGSSVVDSSLWVAVEAGLVQQTGNHQFQGKTEHLRFGGLTIPVEPALIRTKGGGQVLVQPSAVADVDVFQKPGEGEPTYSVTVTTQMRLPDGTSITQTAQMTINYVPTPSSLKVDFGHYEQVPVDPHVAGSAAYALSQTAAHVVARATLLGIGGEPPSTGGSAHGG